MRDRSEQPFQNEDAISLTKNSQQTFVSLNQTWTRFRRFARPQFYPTLLLWATVWHQVTELQSICACDTMWRSSTILRRDKTASCAVVWTWYTYVISTTSRKLGNFFEQRSRQLFFERQTTGQVKYTISGTKNPIRRACKQKASKDCIGKHRNAQTFQISWKRKIQARNLGDEKEFSRLGRTSVLAHHPPLHPAQAKEQRRGELIERLACKICPESRLPLKPVLISVRQCRTVAERGLAQRVCVCVCLCGACAAERVHLISWYSFSQS